MTGDKLRDAARKTVRDIIEENGGEVARKRKKARKAVPFKAPDDDPAPVQLERILKITDRAARQVNGNLFKLEPDQPVDDRDLPGEYTPEGALRKKTKAPVLDEKAMWSKVFTEDRLNLEDLLPYRVRVAWRMVREIARLKGLIADDEGLEEILAIRPDPWIEPVGYTVDDKAMYSRVNPEVAAKLTNISLLPPPAPNNATLDSYNPRRDVVLGVYMDTIHFVSLYLQVRRGSVLDPSQGRYGLYGLEDATLIRLAFPSRLQVLAWEELVVEETFKCMADNGQAKAEEFLRETYGLQTYEILSLIKLAKGKARKRLENDLEEDRAVMVFRLEELASRAKDGLDLRVELGALKQMALVMGLGRTEPEDALQDFIQVVGRVSGASKRKDMEIPTKPARLIEG